MIFHDVGLSTPQRNRFTVRPDSKIEEKYGNFSSKLLFDAKFLIFVGIILKITI